METLTGQVRRARWRLGLQRFLNVLGWCWFAAMLVALAGIVAGKLRWLELEPWVWAGAALGAGLVAAVLWVVLTRRGPIDAAIEIDRRFGLKERVSSALALSPEEAQSEAGRALWEDAVRRADRIDVDERFQVRPDKRLLLPLAPGLAALAVALLVSPIALPDPAVAAADPALARQAVEKAQALLAQKLEKQRKEAEKAGLKDAEHLFKKLQQETQQLSEKTEGDRKKASVQLNDLAKEIEKQREKLGGAEQLRNQLRQLKKLDQDGPAEKFAKAVSRGDFQQAMKELGRLKDQIEGGALSDQQKEDLAKQLDEIKDRLAQAAQAQEQTKKDLQEQLDKAQKAGDAEQASKLQDALDKLAQQGPQTQQLQNLAKRLGQCSQCMKDGQMKDAAGQLRQLQEDLDGLAQQLGQMEMLDEALEQLAMAREQMNCPKCAGQGCAQCQGFGQGEGEGEGDGLGKGRGKGFRPENEAPTKFYDTKAQVNVGKGAASIVDMVDGPNVRGETAMKIQEELEAAQTAESDPITSARLPRKHRQQVQEYFEQIQPGGKGK